MTRLQIALLLIVLGGFFLAFAGGYRLGQSRAEREGRKHLAEQAEAWLAQAEYDSW